ncbi:hypothetical protein B0O99DRAFT_695576 [Bisporella sp. PMI_857]|nr:hypothetical protein B0O99DRAFT_695576 [Bisporella sp. PMI_857]
MKVWVDALCINQADIGDRNSHVLRVVQVELWLMFRKEYWSRLWIIQELAVSPMTSPVHRGESVFHLSTLQAIGDILATYSESRPSSNSEIWEGLRPRLDLLAWITLWRILERGDIEQGGKRLCGPGMHIKSVEDEKAQGILEVASQRYTKSRLCKKRDLHSARQGSHREALLQSRPSPVNVGLGLDLDGFGPLSRGLLREDPEDGREST